MKRFAYLFILIFFIGVFYLDGKIIVFYTPDCEDCYTTLTNSEFCSLEDKGILYFDINKVENYELLLKVEKFFNRKPKHFPIVVCKNKLFAGRGVIQNLPIIKTLAAETTPIDSFIKKGISEGSPHWENEVIPNRKKARQENTVYIAFFTKAGCKRCDRTEKMLSYIKKKYPFVIVKVFDTVNRENQKIQEAISIALGVPENEKLISPTVFLCDTFLVGREINENNIREIIEKNKGKNFIPPWIKGEQFKKVVKSQIVERFKEFSPFVVFVAGLIDGVNPCAFATIVFFLSFMAIIGRSKREIMLTGITFISVLYIVYFAIGIFLYRLFEIKFFISLRGILYYLIAAFAFILAVISLFDAVMLRKGRVDRMILKLPRVVKKTMETTIIKGSRLWNYIIAAFISAVVVSFLEFTCTGQIYIPTIFFVTGISSVKLKATLFLILYNIAFVIPIILLFLLFVIGLSSEKLYSFMRRRAFLLKIATAVIFFALAISLFFISH